MDFTLTPSLKSSTLLQLAIALWNHDDVRCTTYKLFFSKPFYGVRTDESLWEKLEEAANEKVRGLPLPERLRKELSTFVAAVGWQILQWVYFHENMCKVPVRLPKEFCWTRFGTIDKKKTAELLLSKGTLTGPEQYIVACVYCLEDQIYSLWQQQRQFWERYLSKMKVLLHPLVLFWSYYLEGQFLELYSVMRRCCVNKPVNPYEYAFHYSAISGNEVATNHFLEKLSPQQREAFVVKTAQCLVQHRCSIISEDTDFPKECYTAVLCFLLSNMREEQQMEVFISYPYYVLKCFLDWPWQDLFMEVVQRMWPHLSKENYYCLFRFIACNKIATDSNDYDYRKLLKRFWNESPSTHKKYITDECMTNSMLLDNDEIFKPIFMEIIKPSEGKMA